MNKKFPILLQSCRPRTGGPVGISNTAHMLLGARGCFKNTYELLNLRALKFSSVNKYTSFSVWVRYFMLKGTLWNTTKYLTHWLKDDSYTRYIRIMHEWITILRSRVRRIANDFHEWQSHKWKSLANRLTSDPKIVIHGNECIILFLKCYFMSLNAQFR